MQFFFRGWPRKGFYFRPTLPDRTKPHTRMPSSPSRRMPRPHCLLTFAIHFEVPHVYGVVIEFSLAGVCRGWCIWHERIVGYQGCSIGGGWYEIALSLPFFRFLPSCACQIWKKSVLNALTYCLCFPWNSSRSAFGWPTTFSTRTLRFSIGP